MPWASSAHFIHQASSARFLLPYLFHSHWFLLNPLDFLGPITTSLPFGLIGLYANLMNLLIPFLGFPGPFYFFSISYNSHEFTTSFRRLPRLICFLPSHLLFLWACWPLFLPFWLEDLCFTIFSPHLFHFVRLLLPLGSFVKIGH